MKDNEPTREPGLQDEDRMSEAEIDRNLQDTFPASDPPSWTLGIHHHDLPAKDSEDDEPSQT